MATYKHTLYLKQRKWLEVLLEDDELSNRYTAPYEVIVVKLVLKYGSYDETERKILNGIVGYYKMMQESDNHPEYKQYKVIV